MSSDFPFELASFVRHTDPPTSGKAVTAQNKMRWGTQEHRLLVEYAEGKPMTDEEASNAAGLTGIARSPWRRCTELRHKGLIAPTGEERISSAGSPQMVCAVTLKGQLALQGLTGK